MKSGAGRDKDKHPAHLAAGDELLDPPGGHRGYEEADRHLAQELSSLRQHLDQLASRPDGGLSRRYALGLPRKPPGLYWQVRWMAGLVVRTLEFFRIWRPKLWTAALKQRDADLKVGPLLIWAVETDIETLRRACAGLSSLLDSLPKYAPVLVTDVADFAFFSRLGWLVEYLPRIDGDGEPYHEQKAAFLARIYSGAPALPASIGVGIGLNEGAVRQWLERQARDR